MNAAADWRWPLTIRVRAGEQTPYQLWIYWHFYCLLTPRGTA